LQKLSSQPHSIEGLEFVAPDMALPTSSLAILGKIPVSESCVSRDDNHCGENALTFLCQRQGCLEFATSQTPSK